MGNKPITLARAVDLYFRSDRMIQAARGTREQHRRTLNALIAVCGGGRSLPHLTADDFSTTIDLLRRPADSIEMAVTRVKQPGKGPRSGRSEVSLNIDRSVLRNFVRFLHNAGHLNANQNPSSSLQSARKTRGQSHKRQPMLREALIELMDLAGEYHPRERIAVALAALGGLRECEIQGLRWCDVLWRTPDGPMLDFFRPKGRDAHRIALNPTLERELRDWHAWYSARHPEMRPSWYVVPARRRGVLPGGKAGQGMNRDWPIIPDRRTTRRLRPTIKPLMDQVGVPDLYGKGMHTLRRTFANQLLEYSKDIRVVQNALGHKSQLTTETYLDQDRDFAATSAALRAWNPFAPREVDGNVIPLRRRDAS